MPSRIYLMVVEAARTSLRKYTITHLCHVVLLDRKKCHSSVLTCVHRLISASTLNAQCHFIKFFNTITYILNISNKTVKIRNFKTLPSYIIKNDPVEKDMGGAETFLEWFYTFYITRYIYALKFLVHIKHSFVLFQV